MKLLYECGCSDFFISAGAVILGVIYFHVFKQHQWYALSCTSNVNAILCVIITAVHLKVSFTYTAGRACSEFV